MNSKKRWKYPADLPITDTLQKSLNVSPVVAALLANRGLTTVEAAKKFLKPALEDLSSPFDIKDLEKGADLLNSAIQKKEKIVIYGDYDVDGITATAILVKVLKKLGGNVSYYIPHRYHEGYSLNLEAVDKLAAEGTQWMVTVDCGISHPDEIKYAKSKGIKVIVTDHHMPPLELPVAEAIINPKLGPKDTPFYFLAGVGVAYKLVQGMYLKNNIDIHDAENILSLVALGTVADMVPLIGENRILTYFGLQQLARGSCPGIDRLKRSAKLKKDITSRSIGYMLGPRINAAGRLEDAGIAVDLILAENDEQAAPLAAKLNYLNSKRQDIGRTILEDAEKILESEPNILKNKVIILDSEKWHPGVTGIVASQLVRKYNRPAVLITKEGPAARGSIRSPQNMNIFNALCECHDLFINFGGHAEAAGFEIKIENLTEFKERYRKILNAQITEDMLTPELNIDMELRAADISLELVEELSTLAPYGQGNSLPIFYSNAFEIEDFRTVGDGSHLKVTFKQDKKYFDGIGFGLGEYSKDLLEHKGTVNIAFSLEVNEWNKRKKTQLHLYDIKKGA